MAPINNNYVSWFCKLSKTKLMFLLQLKALMGQLSINCVQNIQDDPFTLCSLHIILSSFNSSFWGSFQHRIWIQVSNLNFQMLHQDSTALYLQMFPWWKQGIWPNLKPKRERATIQSLENQKANASRILTFVYLNHQRSNYQRSNLI